MVYYITTAEHLMLLKELCEKKEMGFEYTTNIKDIKLFVNTEVKKLTHVKYFVIDIDCLQNTDKEIYDSICGMQYMTDSRVIVVALGRNAEDSLINALISRNICNLVLSKDMETAKSEIEECMSKDGRTKDTVAPQAAAVFAPPDTNVYSKPVKPVTPTQRVSPITADKTEIKNNIPIYKLPVKSEISAVGKSLITIGVCGVEPHVGTTHHALALAAYLTEQKEKACYLESNIHGDIQKMLDIYEGSSSTLQEDGGINWNGVMIYHDYSFLDVLSMGYRFYIYDYGACRDITSQEFISNDIKILVSGAKPWEYYNYSKVIEGLAAVPNLYTIMNFSVPEQRKMLCLEELKEQTYFAEYSPSFLYGTENDGIYASILSAYINGNLKKSETNISKMKKRLFGGFRK